LLVFHLAAQAVALRLENIQQVVPMAQLAKPPGLPVLLEGILNMSGSAVPVLRLDRLFQLPLQQLGLYSALIIVNPISDHGRIALLADRVSEILAIPESALLPISEKDSFNGCAEAVVSVGGQMIYLLSPQRLLGEKDREELSLFQAMAQRRLRDWEPEAL
jgi:purine-binding chemotaxis protein CheW